MDIILWIFANSNMNISIIISGVLAIIAVLSSFWIIKPKVNLLIETNDPYTSLSTNHN